MADFAETIIGEIQAAYDNLVFGLDHEEDETQSFSIGRLDRNKNDAVGQIYWIEVGGTFGGTSSETGGENAAITQALAIFLVHFWFSTVEECRNALHDLITSARQTVHGPNFTPQRWDRPTEEEAQAAHYNDGHLFALTCQIQIPVKLEGTGGVTTVTIESHHADVSPEQEPDYVTIVEGAIPPPDP